MRQDRFLTGILAGIAILAALSLAVYLGRRNNLSYGPENTPEGVTRNYVIALQRGDYERAYTYLADFENKPTPPRFIQPFSSYQIQDFSLTGVEITDTSTAADGRSALVYLVLLHSGNGPFGQGYRENGAAELALEGGEWKIRNMPYPFWNYEWALPQPTGAIKQPPAMEQ